MFSYDDAERQARACARVFLIVAIPAIVALALIIAPFGAADEPTHFLRIAAIANGKILPKVALSRVGDQVRPSAGGPVDSAAAAFAASADERKLRDPDSKASVDTIKAEFRRAPNRAEIFAAHNNTAIYPPFLYLPAAASFTVLIWLGEPPVLWLYLGRLVNALLAAALVARAISRGRDTAPFLLLVSTSPIFIFQIATLSVDALLLPAAVLFASLLTRLATRQSVSNTDLILLMLAALLLGIGKIAYLPLIGLPPLMARLADRRWSRRGHHLLLASGLTGMVWLGWAYLVHDKIFSIRPGISVAPLVQIAGIAADPIRFTHLLGDLLHDQGGKLLRKAFGYSLGWLEFGMPKWFINTEIAALVAAAIVASRADERSQTAIWSTIAATFACAVAAVTLIYAQYNAPGAPSIFGVQGRYFTPLLVLIGCITPRIAIGRRMTLMLGLVVALSATSAVFTLTRVFERYWI